MRKGKVYKEVPEEICIEIEYYLDFLNEENKQWDGANGKIILEHNVNISKITLIDEDLMWENDQTRKTINFEHSDTILKGEWRRFFDIIDTVDIINTQYAAVMGPGMDCSSTLIMKVKLGEQHNLMAGVCNFSFEYSYEPRALLKAINYLLAVKFHNNKKARNFIDKHIKDEFELFLLRY